MKIFDCFMYFDEEVILDLRLNILNPYIDYFIIVESSYTHKGDKRNLKFDIKKFDRFKEKIIYLTFDEIPSGIEEVFEDDSDDEKSRKIILNAAHRENEQRNYISKGLRDAQDDDLVLISDVDEIPNLQNLKLKEIKNEIILFKQDMFYYKLNLKMPDMIWSGTKACKKKYLKSPQWLRDIKIKKKSFWKIFDKKIQLISNGGWHFSFLKSPNSIKNKIISYSHQEFNKEEFTNTDMIKKRISSGEDLFQRKIEYKKVDIDESFPEYIYKNKDMFKNWIL